MHRFYDTIPSMINENKNILFLILTNCINKVFDVFMAVFVISFLFNHTDDIVQIGIYNIVCGLVVGALAYLTGNWLKRGSRLLMYKIGIIATFLFMCAFVFFRDTMVNHVVLFGALYGVMMAFKSFPNNLIRAESISAQNLIKFQGYNEALKNIVRIAAPVVLGFFLTMDSYFRTVEFLAFLALAEFVVFSQIKIAPQRAEKRFELKKVANQWRAIPILKYLDWAEFCRGATVDGALGTLITIYAAYLFKTDLNLGILGSAFYIVSIVLSFLFGRICKSHHFVKILLLSGAMSILSVLLFIIVPDMASFIFYNFCFTVAVAFVRIIEDINIIKISYLPKIAPRRVEYFAMRELILCLGRFFGYGIMIIVGIFGSFVLLKYLLLGLTLFLCIMCISCARMSHVISERV